MKTPEMLDHFEIQRHGDGSLWELGRGAMGVTYKGWDTHLHCTVALKVIHPLMLDNETIRERFLREARSAAQLRHPNIAGASHLGKTGDGGLYYCMEFCDGPTLQDEVTARQSFDVSTAIDVALQVSRALVAAEARHIVHRDIKPANIMLVRPPGEGLVAKVIDFGLARSVAPSAAMTYALVTAGRFMGTAQYASPEQLQEKQVDIRSDFYSLGACLWFMLTGRPVFEGPLAMVMAQVFSSEPPWALVQHQPEFVTALLKHMLAKDPEKRHRSAHLLREELDSCLKKLQATPASSPPTRRMRAPILGSGEVKAKDDRPRRAAKIIVSSHHGPQRPAPAPAPVTPKRTILPALSTDLILGFCKPGAEVSKDAKSVTLDGVDTRSNKPVQVLMCDLAVLDAPAMRRLYVDLARGLFHHPHPALPKVLGYGAHAGKWVVLSDPLKGIGIQLLIQARSRLMPVEALDLLMPVADAAAHAQKFGLAAFEPRKDNVRILSQQRPGGEDPLLNMPLACWGGWQIFVDALASPPEPPADSEPAPIPTPAAAPESGAPKTADDAPPSSAALLARLYYDLLGCPPPPRGKFEPLPRVNELSNEVLSRALMGTDGDGATFIRDLRKALEARFQGISARTRGP